MTENSENSSASQIAHVAVKIPPLWKNNIKLWFVQVESNFDLAKITNDVTKYNHLISSVDPQTLSAVSDILFAPPATDKYETLKQRLITEFSDSENEQLRRLISELHLGDEKPSHLLRKMRELGGKSVNDDFLKSLWFQRLPSEMQAILSISTESLDNLAKMADKIAEVRNITPNNGIFAVGQSAAVSSESEASRQQRDEINTLRGEIAELCKQMERLSRDRSHGTYRGKFFYRHRSSSRGRSKERSSREFCFYHARFGKDARKCKEGCKFFSQNNQGNSQ
jgi:hypothetical protein